MYFVYILLYFEYVLVNPEINFWGGYELGYDFWTLHVLTYESREGIGLTISSYDLRLARSRGLMLYGMLKILIFGDISGIPFC